MRRLWITPLCLLACSTSAPPTDGAVPDRPSREVPEMRHSKYHQPYKKKKTSFLGDLFDF